MPPVLLAELLAQGVTVTPGEAIAIAQQLIRNGAAAPSPDNVWLSYDGSAACGGCDTTAGVYEMALFLQTLVPFGTSGHGALRYTIARGLHEVDARPFDSIEDFSRALRRFEEGDRGAVIRDLLNRIPRRASEGRWRGPAAAAAAALLIGTLASIVAIRSRPARQPAGPTRPAATAPVGAPRATATAGSTIAQDVPVPQPSPREPRLRQHAAASPAKSTQAAAPLPDPNGDLVSAVDAHQRPIFSPAFASNGSALFFHTGGSRDSRSAIAVASGTATGHDLEVMTIVNDGARNYHVQPSPDGRLVAFDSDRDGERGVYVANRDGSDVLRVSGDGYAAVPTWSPDGQRLAYVRAEPGNPKVWNLWLQRLGEARATRLTNYTYGQTWSASWFPGNRRIAYSHEDQLVVLDLETGKTLTFESPVKGRLVRTPAVSPDGTKVIFQVFRHGGWLLDLADRSMRCILSDPSAEEFAWSPDGRRIAFHSRRDGQWGIYVIAG